MEFGALLPERSLEDILAERIRLVIGGAVVDLPVLPIAENRAWKERMDIELGLFLATLATTEDETAVYALFDANEALFMDLLTSYDTSHVLPGWRSDERFGWQFEPEAIEAVITPLGLVRAVLEVWRAARPLADIALTGESLTLEPPRRGSRLHMPSWLQRINGPHGTSSAN